jgi:putative transposase
MRAAYPDDLNEEEWAILEPFFRRTQPAGRKPKYPIREMVNAIFYILRTGCSWRHLPHDFPHWKAVFSRFCRYRDAGVFERVHDRMVELSRLCSGRQLRASGAIVDSQSVKTAHGGERGYCGAKRLNGRKRHILTDTKCNMIALHLSPANENDRNGILRLYDLAVEKGTSPKKNMG